MIFTHITHRMLANPTLTNPYLDDRVRDIQMTEQTALGFVFVIRIHKFHHLYAE